MGFNQCEYPDLNNHRMIMTIPSALKHFRKIQRKDNNANGIKY